jgi:heat shock protein HspQ
VPGRENPIFDRMDKATYFSPQAGRVIEAPRHSSARFAIGDVVRHRVYDFRGVIFDIDPVFANSDEWYEAIPKEVRPAREQPYYHLFAETDDTNYIAYVSQQNLTQDPDGGPVEHPNVAQLFEDFANGRYRLRRGLTH